MDDTERHRLSAFVIDRLASDEGAFTEDVARAIDGLLETPLEDVLDPARVEAAVEGALAKEQVERGAPPLSHAVHLAILPGLRADATRLGPVVPVLY